MKKFIQLTFILISINVSASDWDLFPYQQKSYFIKNTSYAINKIGVHIMDSIKVSGMDSILYFNRNLNLEGAGNCYDEAVNFVMYWGGINHAEFIDSIIKRNDTVFYNHNLSTSPFFFLPKALSGDSWTVVSTYPGNSFNQITISCTNIQIESFLGITDSVKTFTLTPNGSGSNLSNFQIKLSKNYGLIEYVPFFLFMYHPSSWSFYDLKLIGLKKNGIKYGYEQPTFEDYFHLNPGDILMWHRHYDPDWWSPFNPEFHEYYRDSITQSIITTDSVYYVFNRTKKDSGNVITQINNLSVTYEKAGFKNIVESIPNWIGFGDNLFNFPFFMPIWYTDYLDFRIDSITTDTVFGFSASAGEKYMDTLNCYEGWITDTGFNFIIDSRAGVIKHCFYSWGSDCTTLIGYRINGIQSGSLSFLSIDELIKENANFIYPNPAHDIFKINLSFNKIAELKIYDVVGKLIKHGLINSKKEFGISELNPGVYFVKVTTDKQEFVSKLIKQ